MFKRNLYSMLKYEAMRKHKNNINSDNPNERGKYNPSHKQTSGGYFAYERGELPKSYLTKRTMLEKIKSRLNKLKNLNNYPLTSHTFIKKTLLYVKRTNIDEIMKVLSKYSKEELFKTYFKFSGIHYTGNYYRYTKFYQILTDEELLKNLSLPLFTPITCEQLTIQF